MNNSFNFKVENGEALNIIANNEFLEEIFRVNGNISAFEHNNDVFDLFEINHLIGDHSEEGFYNKQILVINNNYYAYAEYYNAYINKSYVFLQYVDLSNMDCYNIDIFKDCCQDLLISVKDDDGDYSYILIDGYDYDNTSTCDGCGEYVWSDNCDNCYTDDDRFYCGECVADCTFYCEDCDRTFSKDRNEYYHTHYDTTICEDCYEDHYYTCEDCGDVFNANDDCYEAIEGCYYCPSCVEEHSSQRTGDYYNDGDINTESPEIVGTIDTTNMQYCINDYHCYDREFIFRQTEEEKGKDNNVYYGAELEIENDGNFDNNRIATYLRNNLNCITAHDGSISNGFEIISDPQTFDYWLSRRDKIAKVFEELMSAKCKSDETTTCGLHFHISRNAFGDTEEEKKETIKNLELIIANFEEELKNFSRRRDFHYTQFLSSFNDDVKKLSKDIIEKVKFRESDRYQVINLQKSATIEIRLFKGSLNIQTFFASLELCHNLIQLARRGDYVGKTWGQLIAAGNYSDLINYNAIRQIKSQIRIKDHTDKIRKEIRKEDNRIIKIRDNQNVIIEQFKQWRENNNGIIRDIANYRDYLCNSSHTDLLSIGGYTEKEKALIELLNNFREIYRKTKDLCYSQTRYITIDKEEIYYYNDGIDRLKNLIDIVEQIKGVM